MKHEDAADCDLILQARVLECDPLHYRRHAGGYQEALQALSQSGIPSIHVDAFAVLQAMVNFPEDYGFTNERQRREEEIFHAALDIADPADRDACVHRTCGDDLWK